MASSHVAALGAVCCLLACGDPPSASTDSRGATNGSADGVPGGTGAPAVDACVQARIDALSGLSQVIARHTSVCSVDGDCAIVDVSLPCQDNCGNAVLAASVAAFESELDQYATSVCPTLPQNCGFAPSCAPITRASCVNGTCRPVLQGTP